ncbi:hypothetical protein COY32_00630, partial [candidate division WWE3 bacterium CG_4_10_14_0_2_um_filter_41_14]
YCVPGSSDPCDAPVAEWKMDENQGSTVNDTSGNSNHGAITGATWNDAGCKEGSCLGGFDDTSGYVDAGNGTSLNITDAITLEAWFKSGNTTSTTNTIIGRLNWADWIWLNYNGSTQLIQANIEGIIGYNSFYTGVPLNEWNHVSVTYDKTAGANNLRLYLNGVLKTSNTSTSSI